MTEDEAFSIFSLSKPCTFEEVRIRYRKLIRIYHPDNLIPQKKILTEVNHQKSADINQAYAILKQCSEDFYTKTDVDEDQNIDGSSRYNERIHNSSTATPNTSIQEVADFPDDKDSDAYFHLDIDIHEAYLYLHEKLSDIGVITYVDPSNGIIEIGIRFEEGPSCSFVCSLYENETITFVSCVITSLEAKDAPHIHVVLKELFPKIQEYLL